MNQSLECVNLLDEVGRPAGGTVTGKGIMINWQNGPLSVPMPGIKPEDCPDPSNHDGPFRYCPSCTWTEDGPMMERQEPNGAFVEGVIEAALQRIQHYNETEFRCRENSLAITHLEEALHWLQHRTADRTKRGVEGTHAA